MRTKNPISLKYKAIFIMFATALFASCEDLVFRKPHEIMGGGTSKAKIPQTAL